jgi:hypothetical protein
MGRLLQRVAITTPTAYAVPSRHFSLDPSIPAQEPGP